MKSKFFLLAFGFCFSLSVFAGNTATNSSAYHFRPGVDKAKFDAMQQDVKINSAGYCEIEVVNSSYRTIRVYGTYLNGDVLSPFWIYPYEYPHYISLYNYYGYCDPGMYVYIDSVWGYHLYGDYTYGGTSLFVNPFQKGEEAHKVELKKRS